MLGVAAKGVHVPVVNKEEGRGCGLKGQTRCSGSEEVERIVNVQGTGGLPGERRGAPRPPLVAD